MKATISKANGIALIIIFLLICCFCSLVNSSSIYEITLSFLPTLMKALIAVSKCSRSCEAEI